MLNKNNTPKKAPLKTHQLWVKVVLSAKADSIKKRPPKGWGARRIWREIETRKGEPGLREAGPPPAERTVSDILAREWAQLSEKQKRDYQYFHWPESLMWEDVPWEASEAAMELLRHSVRRPDSLPTFLQGPLKVPPILQQDRPTVRDVKWFWRVTQAMPKPPENRSTEEHLLFRKLLATVYSIWEERMDRNEARLQDLIRDLEEALIWETAKNEQIKILMGFIPERLWGGYWQHETSEKEAGNGEE